MDIPGKELLTQVERAREVWPLFEEINDHFGLPPFLLYALGSRETNLRPAFTQGRRGDPEPDGHGHGIFQLDDRWHDIPSGFDFDPRAQAEKAADMLSGLLQAEQNDLVRALNRYNSGQPRTELTANGNYGPDCAERRRFLEENLEERLAEDEREAVLFNRAFLQELKEGGWFVGTMLDRLTAITGLLSAAGQRSRGRMPGRKGPESTIPPGDTEGLHPVLFERLCRLHEVCPLFVASGYRTYEEQERLYNKYLAGVGAPANPPGNSNHEAIPRGGEARGLAVDIHPDDENYAAMHDAATEFGLQFPVAGEKWHCQLVENPLSSFTHDPYPGIGGGDLLPDERDALLFTRSFLQELKDNGWFVGSILDRLTKIEGSIGAPAPRERSYGNRGGPNAHPQPPAPPDGVSTATILERLNTIEARLTALEAHQSSHGAVPG